MTAKNDIQRGLRARVYASQDDVQKAIVNASNLLGKRSKAILGNNKVRVQVQSMTVGVTHTVRDGVVNVQAAVEQYRTSQEKLFYLIPVGPRLLVGKQSLITFLKALHQELLAIDNGQGSVQLVGP